MPSKGLAIRTHFRRLFKNRNDDLTRSATFKFQVLVSSFALCELSHTSQTGDELHTRKFQMRTREENSRSKHPELFTSKLMSNTRRQSGWKVRFFWKWCSLKLFTPLYEDLWDYQKKSERIYENVHKRTNQLLEIVREHRNEGWCRRLAEHESLNESLFESWNTQSKSGEWPDRQIVRVCITCHLTTFLNNFPTCHRSELVQYADGLYAV